MPPHGTWERRRADLYDLAENWLGPPAPVRFLPTWDATLLVHARRAGILPEELRPRIFNTKMPQSTRRAVDDEAGRLSEFTR